MKKATLAVVLLAMVMGMAGCDYDDSNDIDLLIPGDSVKTTSRATNHPIKKR